MAIQLMLDKIPSIDSAMEKAAAVERVKSKLRSAQGTKRSFKMETRLVQDVNLRRQFESRLNGLDQQLRTLTADCKALESELARGELFVEGDNDPNVTGMDGVKAGDKLLQEASVLQDKTQDSLSNTRNMIAQSKEVGVSTLEELERQRNVLENIDKEADRIDDNLARAEGELNCRDWSRGCDHFFSLFLVSPMTDAQHC
jgi:novel plant SNARE